MAQASIEVILHGGDMEGSLRRYPPGAELSGAVRVIPDGDVRCNHLHVRLRWHTEGRGDRDESVIHSADVYQGTLRGGGGAPGEYAFQFRLPGAPWSYAGHYVNIVWGIAVEVDVPWSVNPRHEQPFILAPSRGGPETTSKTDAAAAVPASGRFDVFLTGVSRDTAQVAATLQQVVPDFNRETIIEMLRSTPMPVLRNVSPEQADAAARRLRAAGALIDVIPSLPDSPP